MVILGSLVSNVIASNEHSQAYTLAPLAVQAAYEKHASRSALITYGMQKLTVVRG